MTSSVARYVAASALVALGAVVGAIGILVGELDDAPGGALIGIVLMIAAVTIGVRTARRKG